LIVYIPLFEAAVGIEVDQPIAGGGLAFIAFPPGAADRTVTDIGDIVVYELFPEMDMSAEA
jgi:hypothetical protein